ncbi:MAG: CU044_2847 family protein [Leptolyngbyaceae cyanobacterium]
MTMATGSSASDKVMVDLGDGVQVQVEVAATGRQKVAAGAPPLDVEPALKGITKVAEMVAGSIQKVKPTKATVKYGLELGVEQGGLMASIVRGTGKASFEITLEWENKPEKGS